MAIPTLEPAPPTARPSVTERFRAACEVVLAFLGGMVGAQLIWVAVGADPYAILTSARQLSSFLFIDGTLTLLIVFGLLRLKGESARTLGFGTRSFGGEALLGLLVLPGLLVAVGMVGLFFQLFLPEWVTTDNQLLGLIQTPTDVLLFLVSSIYVGGIKEEVQRAFALTRFRDYLGGIIPGLILFNVAFGLGHVTQGYDNALKAGVLGLGFGLLYIWRRDPASAMVAHTAWNVLTVLTIWFFFRAA